MIFRIFVWFQERAFDFSEWMIRFPIRKACRLASKAFKSRQLADIDLAIRVLSARVKQLPGDSLTKNHANHILGGLLAARKTALAAMMQQSGSSDSMNGLPAAFVKIDETW